MQQREGAKAPGCGVFIRCRSEMKYINEHVRLVLLNRLHRLTAAPMHLIRERGNSFLSPNIGGEGRKPLAAEGKLLSRLLFWSAEDVEGVNL